MRICLLIFFVGSLLAFGYYMSGCRNGSGSHTPVLIAHAGGGFQGNTYTNSLEAFDYNYDRGHRLFEADFSWTTDGVLVLIHDWTRTFNQWFNAEGIPSAKQFKSIPMKHGMTQMSLEDLYLWLSKHEDASIVTDVKRNNYDALRLISATSGKRKAQFITQIYKLQEYTPVKNLGFADIILTLYRVNLSDEEIIGFAGNNKLFAVTMPLEKAMSTHLPKNLNEKGVSVFVHTINSPNLWEVLRQRGVSGIYTDFLSPTHLSAKDKSGLR